jgi:hypothetical protein
MMNYEQMAEMVRLDSYRQENGSKDKKALPTAAFGHPESTCKNLLTPNYARIFPLFR